MSVLTHTNVYQYIHRYTYVCSAEDENWLGCGGHRSTHFRRCGEGIVEVLALTVIVTRVSPYDGDGTPHYAGFDRCLEFFRSHDLSDWTTLIF